MSDDEADMPPTSYEIGTVPAYWNTQDEMSKAHEMLIKLDDYDVKTEMKEWKRFENAISAGQRKCAREIKLFKDREPMNDRAYDDYTNECLNSQAYSSYIGSWKDGDPKNRHGVSLEFDRIISAFGKARTDALERDQWLPKWTTELNTWDQCHQTMEEKKASRKKYKAWFEACRKEDEEELAERAGRAAVEQHRAQVAKKVQEEFENACAARRAKRKRDRDGLI